MADKLVILFSIIMVVILVFAIIWGMTSVNVGDYTGGSCELEPEVLCDVGTGIGFPAGWLAPDKIIAWIIAPGILVGAVVYGLMSAIFREMFSKVIKALIALAVGLIMTFSGHFTILVVTLYSIFGIFALIGGAILGFLLIALLLWRQGFGGFKAGKIVSAAKKAYDKEEDRIKDEIKECKEKKKETDKRIEELGKKFSTVTRSAYIEQQFDQLTEIYEAWDNKEKRLKQELEDLKESEKETVKEIKEEAKD